MQVLSTIDDNIDFGGQNQIVNQQEQNREVNKSGLSDTDSEASLNGPTAAEDQESTDKIADGQKKKDATPLAENEEIEIPGRKSKKPL